MTLRVLIALLIMTGYVSANCGQAFHLLDTEIKALVAKASDGDANAAYRMWNFHSMSSQNEQEADKWLRTAARLGHPEAQRWLAYEIKDCDKPPGTFGKTPRAAVESLLRSASRTSGTAADDLGEAYRDGYLKPRDRLAKARQAFFLAAEHHNASSWESLAEMLFNGEGGSADPLQAYYFIVLSTQCVHPDSITGKELWELRMRIEKKLNIEQMAAVWDKADAYLKIERKYDAGRIYPPALLGTGIPKKEWEKRLKETDKKESAHRRSLQTQ
ncbi:MAG: sel1 repeat family protein [Chthoniobacterales bacterium]|nr:sel1 repeat family protein [Chthoniobacterales bacterium]